MTHLNFHESFSVRWMTLLYFSHNLSDWAVTYIHNGVNVLFILSQFLLRKKYELKESIMKNADKFMVKFIYSEKATKFCKISILLLSYVVPVKSKEEISQNFVAFSEYMNFIYSRVHISSDTAFLKILKKPSIVQE